MKKATRIFIVVLAVTILSSIICALFLPKSVKVQGSVQTGAATYLPKGWAILLAAALSVSGAIGVLLTSKEEPKKYYPLTISVIGLILFAYMILVNCLL